MEHPLQVIDITKNKNGIVFTLHKDKNKLSLTPDTDVYCNGRGTIKAKEVHIGDCLFLYAKVPISRKTSQMLS